MKWFYVFQYFVLVQAIAFGNNPDEPSRPMRMVSAFGDYRIGALVPVHILEKNNKLCMSGSRSHSVIRGKDGTASCYKLNIAGVMWSEALRFAILEANKRLKEFKMGYDIRDSLNNVDVALNAAMDFATRRRRPADKRSASSRECSCRTNDTEPYVVTVIGGARSEISQRVNNVLGVASLPQISYSSTSVALSDKNSYRTFLRTIPPDNYQTRAMADIAKSFGWDYVATVATDEDYGRRGANGFHEEARKLNICISMSRLFQFNLTTAESRRQITSIVKELKEDNKTKVVVLFCERPKAVDFLKEAERQGLTGKTWIASEDWSLTSDVYPIKSSVVGGVLGVATYEPVITNFTKHLTDITPTTSSHNPWLQEYFDGNKCQTSDASCQSPRNASVLHRIKASYVMDAAFIVTVALDRYWKCKKKKQCPEMIDLEKLREFMLTANFSGAGADPVTLDKNGNPEGKYQISNLQPDPTSIHKQKFVQVGSWVNGHLEFDQNIVWNGGEKNPPVSRCSSRCPPGKYFVSGDVSCCWNCVLCPAGMFKVNPGNKGCDSCPTGYMSDQNRTRCLRIPEEFIRWNSVTSAILVSLSLFGVLVACFMFGVYFKHRKSPIVKAASRYPSLLLLITIACMFALPLLYIGRPNSAQCHAQPIAFGCLMTLATSLVLTKTFRLIQIFNNVVANLRDKPLVTVRTQFLIVAVFLVIEGIIIAVFLDRRPLEIRTVVQDTAAPIDCGPSAKDLHIAVLLYNGLLAFSCAIMAFRARSLPANFSEARLISFAMFTFSVIWLTFLIAFSGSLVGYISTFVCIAVLATALDLLMCMFAPKIFVILFRPELNEMHVVRADIYRYTLKQRTRSHTPQYENSESELTRSRADTQHVRPEVSDVSFNESKL